MAYVLVVEDEPQVLILAEGILEDAGHTTKSVANAAQALALLRSGQPFDILFTDLNLGKNRPNGLSLASEAVLIRKGLGVLYTSGEPMTGGMKELFVENGVFLPKIYTPEQLLEKIAAISSR